MSMFLHPGPRTRRLQTLLRQRATVPRAREALDARAKKALFQTHAIVYTDTADFTARTLRDGILHFLMVFDRFVRQAEPLIAGLSGDVVKIEADSLMLRFPDANAACRAVVALDALVRRAGRGRPANEQLRFSYGIGYGEVLSLENDVFGLEVNLASKLGEDLARPGEALLTPAAAAALDARTLRLLVPHCIVTFGRRAIPVNRLKLRRS